jgi:hypothetical protein
MREFKFRVWDEKRKDMKPCAFFGGHLPGYIIMQWTGLKDKNGKEIYEGDIGIEPMPVNIIWQNIVTWLSDEAAFHIAPGNCEFTDDDIEVIGNIYENPDLIKNIE